MHSEAAGEVQFDATMKNRIIQLAQQSYRNVRNCWNGEECFSCSLMHQFFQSLVHLHCKEITSALQAKIREYFCRAGDQEKRCINNRLCFNFEPLQWKNNQKSAILSILQKIISMMVQSTCKSPNPNERKASLLDVEYTINCKCSKCEGGHAFSSDKGIEIKDREELTFNSFTEIQRCLKKVQCERPNIQRIFELIREERKKNIKVLQAKKTHSEGIFNLYGSLMLLDKQKHQNQYEQPEKKKQKIYDELSKKNASNSREIKRFYRKMSMKKNQEKLSRLSFQSQTCSTVTSASNIRPKKSQDISRSVPISSSHRLPRHNIKIRQRTKKPEVPPMPSIEETMKQYARMQQSVEKALDKMEHREQKRVNILKSVLFNPNVFMERQPAPTINIERPYFNRFQRVMKSSRQMTKFASIRPFFDEATQKYLLNA